MANEKRLIDVNALVKDHCEGCNALRDGLCYPFEDPVCGAVQTILETPTIDAVEVVRCKDCRMYFENKEARVTFCRRELNDLYAVPDGFCSYGERRNGNGDS